jgi:hypothetical protein
MTEWAVTAAAPQLLLDPSNRAEMTFTVTNPGDAPDRAVFLVEPEGNVPRSWFTVAEPQRRVPPHGSTSYLVAVTVPPNTPPGDYAFLGCVYSANTAPEESSRRSGRVTFAVRPAEQPKRPWWPYAVAAGLVLVVLVVAGWLVFRPRGTTPAAVASSPAPAPVVSSAPSPVRTYETTMYEMELLQPVTRSPGVNPIDVVVQKDCCGVSWSNHAQLFFTARAVRQSISVPFVVPVAGLYIFSSIRTKSKDYGNTVYLIDDQQVGGEFAGYSPTVVRTDWVTSGSVRFEQAGSHRLTVLVVGKADESSSFYAGVDAIRLTRTAG